MEVCVFSGRNGTMLPALCQPRATPLSPQHHIPRHLDRTLSFTQTSPPGPVFLSCFLRL